VPTACSRANISQRLQDRPLDTAQSAWRRLKTSLFIYRRRGAQVRGGGEEEEEEEEGGAGEDMPLGPRNG